MAINWTNEAIEAALDAWQSCNRSSWADDMRAALDAAVEAQGMTAGWINRAVDDAYAEGRADAAERKVEKLRAAIHSAYVEGWTDSMSWDDPKAPGVIDQEWEASLARAALKETGDD